MSNQPDSSSPFPQIQQYIQGDRNQAIGQAYSCLIVYGSPTIVGPGLDNRPSPAPGSSPAESAVNPYKGLLFFNETDSTSFFGRSQDTQYLWEKFRDLQHGAMRLLPVYGPSGSGKSSLVRAGLLPKMSQQPLLGQEMARVAVLVPGTQPLQALAKVLAQIAESDSVPVRKSREFAEELEIKNRAGEYDGLQRIARALPKIDTSPLIVLVDQFEEVYSLCKNSQARDAMIANLLYAASDRSQYVSVILTMRSDFLPETQKHPPLNRLFSSQGFLVPTMDAACLREAIVEPAKQTGYTIDTATVNLLIEQTEGREGALPLLQFALTRIWEKLGSGVEPAETLEQIRGVGGALAGEAQRVYESLTDNEKSIARRVFLGLVQLGEGIRDTRRRVLINKLVSHKNDLSLVKQVIGRFTEQGVRLLTCSANGNGTETVEVTHEALFAHWQSLKNWLDEKRDDLRFQRRLEEAAEYWKQNNRPDGNLWQPPDLYLLKQYEQKSGDEMSVLEMEFLKKSLKKQRHTYIFNILLPIIIILGSIGAISAIYFIRHRIILALLMLNKQNIAGIDISGSYFAYPEADFSKANLSKANLSKTNLTGVDLSEANLEKARLVEAHMPQIKLQCTNLSQANLSKINLTGADLSKANLEKAQLVEAYMVQTKLQFTNLSQSDLSKANLNQADLSKANLKGSLFEEAYMTKANFTRANLFGANFIKANLEKADLSRTNLREARFEETYMPQTNLTGADLFGADFRSTQNITPEQIKSAKNWSQAIYDKEFCQRLELKNCRTQ